MLMRSDVFLDTYQALYLLLKKLKKVNGFFQVEVLVMEQEFIS